MSRILGVLLAVVLVFGIAFAYSGFDIDAGTGTIGIGQVDHPTQGDAPLELVATRTATIDVAWTCTRPDQSLQSSWTATATQEYVATAPAKLNPKDMVLNYTFGGWVEGAFTIVDSDHPYDWYLQCLGDNILDLVSESVTYSDVAFD